MKIAVVNNFFPPRPGGSSHLADHLAKEYAKAGHEVLVMTASYLEAPATEEHEGFRVVRIPAWTLPKNRFASNFDIGFTISPRAKKRVFDVLDNFAPDVIHQHGQFFDLTWLSGWWARKRRVPTLLSIHTRLESPLSKFNSLIYGLADQLLVAPLMKIHRPVLVVMDVLMDEYINRRYKRSISGRVVIPVGIDAATLKSGNGAIARARHDLGDRHIVLSIGHVIPQRSRLALVRALPAVLARFPNVAVIVIGGVYHDEFLHEAKQLGVEKAIYALGALPQAAIPDYLAAADLEVHELEGIGFGTASLEALAVGIPVVARIRPDNFVDIVIENGREMFLAPPVSAEDQRADPDALAIVLNSILEDPGRARASVSINAQTLIEEHFTIRRVAERHLAKLHELVLDSKATKLVGN